MAVVRHWECPEARIQKGIVCCRTHAHLWLHRWSKGIWLHHRGDLRMLLRHGSHLNWWWGSNLVWHGERIICHEWIRCCWTIQLLLLPLPVGPIIIKAVQNELVESATLKNEARSLFWLNAARNGTNCQIVWNTVAMIQCLWPAKLAKLHSRIPINWFKCSRYTTTTTTSVPNCRSI